MASRDTKDLHKQLATVWQQAAGLYKTRYPHAPQPFLTATFRSLEEQNELFRQGRSRPGPKVTWAQAGQSPHNYCPSYAFDIAFKRCNGSLDWSEYLFSDFAAIVAEVDKRIVWGGTWSESHRDMPHFELKGWKKKAKTAGPIRPATGRVVLRLQNPLLVHPAVGRLQRKLMGELAVSLSIDNCYGEQTERAVRRFQQANELQVDGIVGLRTAQAIGLKI